MYTMEQLCGTGIVTTSTNLEGHHLQTGQPAGSELCKSNITDTEGACDTAEENTDTEMV